MKTTIRLMVVFLFCLHHSLSQPRIELQKSGKTASLVARYTASEKLLKMINLVLNR
ncbi:hypothetical protein [Spirosoma sp. KUDC1026]|uniref:hypothetical protein n=1 Tax=Spirosoma sp. KUDC1026 TaxID=2745947 RepID=UPI00159BA268|nr:hypothetical protein [Spirosoma sp. KUDC1026]QKZ12769.1 hypothetical protein HU175_09050 [Spirosoma sp. KUDC1026]